MVESLEDKELRSQDDSGIGKYRRIEMTAEYCERMPL